MNYFGRWTSFLRIKLICELWESFSDGWKKLCKTSSGARQCLTYVTLICRKSTIWTLWTYEKLLHWVHSDTEKGSIHSPMRSLLSIVERDSRSNRIRFEDQYIWSTSEMHRFPYGICTHLGKELRGRWSSFFIDDLQCTHGVDVHEIHYNSLFDSGILGFEEYPESFKDSSSFICVLR